MAATNPWDETIPTGADLASSIDNFMRTMKLDVRERMAINHVFGVSQSTDGYHTSLSFSCANNTVVMSMIAAPSTTGANTTGFADLAMTLNTSGVVRVWKFNVTNTASAAGSLFVDYQVGGTTKWNLNFSGDVVTAGSHTIASDGFFFFGARSTIYSPADGRLAFYDNARSHGFEIKTTTNGLAQFRTGTDAADASISAANATFSGDLTLSGDIILTSDDAKSIGSTSNRLYQIVMGKTSNNGIYWFDNSASDVARATFVPHATTPQLKLFVSDGTTSASHLFQKNGAIIAGAAIQFSGYGAGTLTTDASGNITATSDVRLKEVVDDFRRSLQTLRGIRPILYRWNERSGFDTRTTYAGFSAQNVRSFLPEAVSEDPQGNLTISDRPILATLINAVNELANRLDHVTK